MCNTKVSEMKFLSVFTSLIILSFLYLSCEEEKNCFNSNQNLGDIEGNYDLGKCFVVLADSQYVFTNIEDFQELRSEIDEMYLEANAACDTAILKNPDFEKYSLLGMRTMVQACAVAYVREVKIDIAARKYIYSIKATPCGDCNSVNISMNWVLVPKIPQDFTVDFLILK